MLNVDISFWIALSAGFLSFFSPCILPMIPAYIMYITGSGIKELKNKRGLALFRTIGFVFGFTIIFIIMGTSASFLGQIFVRNKEIFAKISGLVLIVFGLNMLGLININILNRESRKKRPSEVRGFLGAILMGMAFAAGWTPCFGPVLGSILIYAGSSETISKGVFLLLVYSLGMGIPFILTALFIDQFTRILNKYEEALSYLPKLSGLILIVFGTLVFFNKVIDISRILIR